MGMTAEAERSSTSEGGFFTFVAPELPVPDSSSATLFPASAHLSLDGQSWIALGEIFRFYKLSMDADGTVSPRECLLVTPPGSELQLPCSGVHASQGLVVAYHMPNGKVHTVPGSFVSENERAEEERRKMLVFHRKLRAERFELQREAVQSAYEEARNAIAAQRQAEDEARQAEEAAAAKKRKGSAKKKKRTTSKKKGGAVEEAAEDEDSEEVAAAAAKHQLETQRAQEDADEKEKLAQALAAIDEEERAAVEEERRSNVPWQGPDRDDVRGVVTCALPDSFVPHGSAGAVSLSLSLSGVEFVHLDQTLVVRAPVPTAALPVSGPVTGGTRVTVHGSFFFTDEQVQPKVRVRLPPSVVAVAKNTENEEEDVEVEDEAVVQDAWMNEEGDGIVFDMPKLSNVSPGEASIAISLVDGQFSSETVPFHLYIQPDTDALLLSEASSPLEGGQEVLVTNTSGLWVGGVDVSPESTPILVKVSPPKSEADADVAATEEEEEEEDRGVLVPATFVPASKEEVQELVAKLTKSSSKGAKKKEKEKEKKKVQGDPAGADDKDGDEAVNLSEAAVAAGVASAVGYFSFVTPSFEESGGPCDAIVELALNGQQFWACSSVIKYAKPKKAAGKKKS